MKLTSIYYKILTEALSDYGLQAAVMIIKTKEIFTGKSHAEAMMKLHDKHPDFDFEVDDFGDLDLDAPIEDGFWNEKTKEFISREEAYQIVNGQGDEFDELHSGDA